MSYLSDVQLRDLDEDVSLEIVCKRCLHTWIESPTQLLMKIFHRDMYLEEVEKNLACKKPGCRHVGMTLRVVDNDETSGFVGGMP